MGSNPRYRQFKKQPRKLYENSAGGAERKDSNGILKCSDPLRPESEPTVAAGGEPVPLVPGNLDNTNPTREQHAKSDPSPEANSALPSLTQILNPVSARAKENMPVTSVRLNSAESKFHSLFYEVKACFLALLKLVATFVKFQQSPVIVELGMVLYLRSTDSLGAKIKELRKLQRSLAEFGSGTPFHIELNLQVISIYFIF